MRVEGGAHLAEASNHDVLHSARHAHFTSTQVRRKTPQQLHTTHALDWPFTSRSFNRQSDSFSTACVNLNSTQQPASTEWGGVGDATHPLLRRKLPLIVCRGFAVPRLNECLPRLSLLLALCCCAV